MEKRLNLSGVRFMKDRIEEELKLLRKYYPKLEIDKEKKWILIHKYQLPKDKSWNKNIIDVCFTIPQGYPGTNPYGIYIPDDLLYNNQSLDNFKQSPSNKPPFPGNWGILSWSPDNGQWKPTDNIITGSNLLNFVRSFSDRFKEGK